MQRFIFRMATPRDQKRIRALLGEVFLPYEDVAPGKQDFLLAEGAGQLAGCVGLQASGKTGLLRSLAVKKGFRRKGLSRELFERLLTLADSKGIESLYLLTTTAAAMFRKWGFRAFPRTRVPLPIRRMEEFASLCPSSAICLKRDLRDEALFYPKDLLALKPDVPGSRMWGIALQKAMLTYFEVEPRSRFKRHRHPSEQITFVLNGELFFQMDGKTIPVRKGEAIAIPSNVPHAVYTQKTGAKAVDAWSPVMPLYK